MQNTNLCRKLYGKLPLLFIISIPTVYTFISFNRYLPVQEGWFHYYVQLMDSGRMPYRDFLFPLQPIYLLLCNLITGFFGTDFIVMRIYGLIERSFLVLLVYSFLNRYFNKEESCIATLLGFFLYTSLNVDLPYSYYQTTLIFSVLSVYMLTIGIEDQRKSLLFYAGIFTSLSFFTKQSAGVIVFSVNVAALSVIIYRRDNYNKSIISAIVFLAGFALPAIPLLYWLISNEALPSYFNQVFLSYTSKGGFLDILFGFLLRLIKNVKLIPATLTILSILLLLFLGMKKRFKIEYITAKDSKWFIPAVMIIFLSFLLPYFYNLDFSKSSFILSNRFQHIRLLTLIGIILLIIRSLMIWIKSPCDDKNNFILLGSMFSFAWMYSHGMSGNLEAPALFFGFALLLVTILDLLEDTLVKSLAILAIIPFAATLIVRISSERYAIPYAWWGWMEPDIRIAKVSSDIPKLKGFRLCKRTADLYMTINNMILQHTNKEDGVFTFPHITIFNVLANRTNQLFTPVNYFDVCSDPFAVRTAHELEQIQPKMIIYMDFPEDAWLFHEERFRNGRQCGQRNIMEVINKLVAANKYRVIYVSPTSEFNYPIKILLKTT